MFQLDFADFYLEESDGCLYDSLTILGDVEGTEEIGRMDESLDVSLASFISSFFSHSFPPPLFISVSL